MADTPAEQSAESAAKTARTPKHWTLKDRLTAMVNALGPGAALPGERGLAEGFSVSRTTLRKALAELVAEGRLTRVRGSGTYAASGKITQRLQLSSYTEDMRAQGLHPATRLLESVVVAADPESALLLGVRVGDDVLRLKRLRTADGEPMAVEDSLLPLSRFPGLRHLVGDGSLYAVLWEHYGVTLGHAEETIETALATPEDAALLGNEPGAVMLLLSRHSFDTARRPVEWVRSVYRGDRYKFTATLRSPRAPE